MRSFKKTRLKNAFLVLVIGFMFSGFVSSTKRDIEIAESIKGSIKTGNARNLAVYFERNLELVIDTERVSFRNVNGNQAELILRNFFKKYPAKEFRYVYQGTASKVRYCTATYQSAGASFQVYILMRVSGNDYRINTLHFKKE
jgi:Domain of unknown function (DUF4783)